MTSIRGRKTLGKITDKYSTSNEHHARRLDLAILIMARRARRAARRFCFVFLLFSSAAFFLAFVCARVSSFFLPLGRREYVFYIYACVHVCRWVNDCVSTYAHRVELSRDNLRGMMLRVRVDSKSNLLRICLKSWAMIRLGAISFDPNNLLCSAKIICFEQYL